MSESEFRLVMKALRKRMDRLIAVQNGEAELRTYSRMGHRVRAHFVRRHNYTLIVPVKQAKKTQPVKRTARELVNVYGMEQTT